MAKLRFTNKAVEDLGNIWQYTAQTWSERQADSYYNMLIEACQEVARNPMALGRLYDTIAADLRGFKVGRHILFYRMVSRGEVEIIRILHGYMDLKNHLS